MVYYPELGLRQLLHYFDDTYQVEMPGQSITDESNSLSRDVRTERALKVIDNPGEGDITHPYKTKLQHLVASPMLSAGILRGLIEIGREDPSPFSAIEIAAIQQMSGQIAVALTNAETVNRSQKVARNKVLASEIGTRLQQQPDLERMADITIQHLSRALGAKRARIRLALEAPPPPRQDDTPGD